VLRVTAIEYRGSGVGFGLWGLGIGLRIGVKGSGFRV
jgi:hypothetical protein